MPRKNRTTWSPEPLFKKTARRPDSVVCVKSGDLFWGGKVIGFPVGWTSDGASVPRIFQHIVPRFGYHAIAAFAHDRAIEVGWPRKLARQLMTVMLEDNPNVPWWRRRAMVTGVWLYDTWLAAGGGRFVK